MICCGYGLCGDRHALDFTPTAVKNIRSVLLQNGIYDELYISRDTSGPYTTDIPGTWDFDTILHARFQGNLHAGNVEYSIGEISHIRIKRRERGSFDWVTLFEIPIADFDDFRFQLYDRYNRAKTEYEYALVPVTNNVEGNLNINHVYSDFDGVYLTEKDRTFNTALSVEVSVQKNHPSEVVGTLGRVYPYIVGNSRNNYYSGTVTATFIEYNPAAGDWNVGTGWKYRRALMAFLENSRPKILKLHDGRMWLVNVMDAVTESPQEHADAPVTTISWTETGDAESVQDLYFNGLIDVNPEWWVMRG